MVKRFLQRQGRGATAVPSCSGAAVVPQRKARRESFRGAARELQTGELAEGPFELMSQLFPTFDQVAIVQLLKEGVEFEPEGVVDQRPNRDGGERAEVMRIAGGVAINDDFAVEVAPHDRWKCEAPTRVRAHPPKISRTLSPSSS